MIYMSDNKLYGWYAYSDWVKHGQVCKDINGNNIYVTCVSTSSVLPCSTTKGLMMVGQIETKTLPKNNYADNSRERSVRVNA